MTYCPELLVTMAAASLDLRLGKSFDEEECTSKTKKTVERRKKTGRPHKAGIAAYARVFEVATTGPPNE